MPTEALAARRAGSRLTPTSLSAAERLCRRVAHRAGPNFSVGFRLLPPAKRRAVYAAYAFCRFVDDEVDEAAGRGERGGGIEDALDRWQRELDCVYRGAPERPVGQALAAALDRFPAPKAAFEGLIAGCRLDLSKTRYANFDELLEYCRLVAGTISTISLAIFGASDPEAAERAGDHLSTAFQLTNVLRDVGEDLRERDRIYLPLDELARFGVAEDDLRRGEITEEVAALLRFQLERARDYYRRAEPVLGLIERDARRCAWLMGRVYLAILDRIEAGGYAVFGPRIGLSPAAKLALVARSLPADLTRW